MKLKLTLLLMILASQLSAQKIVTNRYCRTCGIEEQYQTNANGDYHGFYKNYDRQGKLIKNYNYLNGDLHGSCIIYFPNGTINEQMTYHKGTMISLKIWSYNENGTKRTLIRNATWDKQGNALEDNDAMNGETAGKLPNGYWSAKYYIPYHSGCYIERYNGNDTIYVWANKSKQTFEGREINGVFIESEERIKEREDWSKQQDLEEANKQAKEDSIRQANRTNYDTEVANIKITSAIYKKFIKDVMDGSEHKFYSMLCDYLKHSTNDTLKSMIMEVLGITIDDLSNPNIDITIELSPNGRYTYIVKKTTRTINGNSIPNSNTLLKSYVYANDNFIRTNEYNDFRASDNLRQAIENNDIQCMLMEIAIYADDIDISQQVINEYAKSISDK